MDPANNDKQISEIEQLKKQADEYLAGWKRAKADLINLQKDVAKERSEWARFASARSLERLLPAIDALKAAAAHLPELDEVVRKFDGYLKAEGLTEIETEGKFDPIRHEVVSKEKKESAQPDTVVTVVQKGYMLHDKVLRPAKVIVAE